MDSGFELFDHTADMGVRAWAPTMPGLIPPAAEGLYGAIGELAVQGAQQPFAFSHRGTHPELLLRDFLTELLILFERDQRKLVEYDRVDFDGGRLIVSGRSKPVDALTSTFFREVKAVTYHELAIRQVAGGVEVVFIVDI